MIMIITRFCYVSSQKDDHTLGSQKHTRSLQVGSSYQHILINQEGTNMDVSVRRARALGTRAALGSVPSLFKTEPRSEIPEMTQYALHIRI